MSRVSCAQCKFMPSRVIKQNLDRLHVITKFTFLNISPQVTFLSRTRKTIKRILIISRSERIPHAGSYWLL